MRPSLMPRSPFTMPMTGSMTRTLHRRKSRAPSAAVTPGIQSLALAHATVAIAATIADLHRDLFLESNPVPVKWALHAMGRIDSGLRLPLVELDPKFHDTLRNTLKKTGAL